MKNTPTSAISPDAQQSLDLQLIEAVRNPRGEAQYENGLAQTVAELLDRGADVNAVKESTGAAALMIAAQSGHTELVAKLWARGADVNAVASMAPRL